MQNDIYLESSLSFAIVFVFFLRFLCRNALRHFVLGGPVSTSKSVSVYFLFLDVFDSTYRLESFEESRISDSFGGLVVWSTSKFLL